MRDPNTKDGDVYSGGSRRGARGTRPPYFLTKLSPEGRKMFFGDRVPPLLSQGLDDLATPLSESLDPPLV